jgi:hypothetical protein
MRVAADEVVRTLRERRQRHRQSIPNREASANVVE